MLFTLRKTNGSLNAVLKVSEKQTFSRPSERAVQMLHWVKTAHVRHRHMH